MPVVHAPETDFAKESVKWEAQGTPMGPGLRPYIKRPYPAVMYRAERVDGQLTIADIETVAHDAQQANALSRGFRDTPNAAFEAIERQELEFAKLHAERNFHERRMTPKAQAEAIAHDAGRTTHLPSVPERPIKRRQKKVAG